MFKNMKIKTKLIIMILIPMLALLYFSVDLIIDKYNISKEMIKIQSLVELSVKISNLVHETQRERGRTGGYLGSNSTKFRNELINQRKLTDTRIKELNQFIKSFDKTIFNNQFNKRLDNSFEALNKIESTRSAILSQNLNVNKALGYYTNLNALFLNVVEYVSNLSSNVEIAHQSSAYVNFLLAKERSGIERAVITNTFAGNKFGAGMFNKFSALVTEQELYIKVFKSFATTDKEKLYDSKSKDNSFLQVQNMRNIAFEKADKGDFGVEADKWFETITKKINILKEIENNLSKSLINQSNLLKSNAYAAFTIYLVGTTIVIILTILIVYFSFRSINKPLRQVITNLKDIAQGEGDLTKKIHVNTKEEMGELAKYFNLFVDKLKTVISQIGEVSNSLAASSEEINASARSLADGAQSQSAGVEETSATMEEFTANVKQISNNINEVNQESQKLMDIAVESLPKVDNAMNSIEKISESSIKIREIVNVINDIADQTNLLSLNASIEAARAGEHGRGFAVVAEEISKLANRSADSTKQIENLMKISIKDIENGVSLVSSATGAFRQIVNGVENTASYIEDITKAIEQQKIGTDQVVESINEISSVTETNAAGAEQMSASTTELQNQAETLNHLVNQFKIEDNSEVSHQGVALLSEKKDEHNTKHFDTNHRNDHAKKYIKWDNSFSVNIKEIDRQHQVLVDIINDLYESMSSGKSKSIMSKILDGLTDYTKKHFSYEEKMMDSYKYHGLSDQLKQHQKFVDKLTDMCDNFSNNKAVLSTELMEFLKDWLTNHIKKTDMEYKVFFNAKGVS